METNLAISFQESQLSYSKQNEDFLKEYILNNLPEIKEELLKHDIDFSYEFNSEGRNKVDINFTLLQIIRISFSIPTLAIIGSIVAKNLKALTPIIHLILQYKIKKSESKDIILKHGPTDSILIIPVGKNQLSAKDVEELIITFLENVEKSKIEVSDPEDNFIIEV